MKSNNNNRNPMTNTEIITKIKAEIERRINELGISDESILLEAELSEILSFISTLESEKSEVDLEKEIEISIRLLNGLHTLEDNKSWYKGRYEELKELARHFYDLGCRRTAEKYDEIEYNRQRAEESVPKDLEEAAKRYSNNKHPMTPTGARESQEDFIAGAKWDREQMMKHAKDGWIDEDCVIVLNDGTRIDLQPDYEKNPAFEFEYAQDVRVIVLPKEDSNE